MSSEPAIVVEHLSKRYRIGATQGLSRYRSLREDVSNIASRRRERAAAKDFWALRDVSFQIDPGQTVGVIGRNGAGKSTLLKLLAQITTPTEGRGHTIGRVGSLLEIGTGFHPELTGRENIQLAGAIMGMRRAEITARFDDIVAFAGLETFLDTPVKRYSSGMYMRLAFSVAAHLEPEILLVDEVLAVGDAEFQRKCLGKMEDLSISGRTVVFVSHSMPSILRLCPRVLLLDGGTLVADGSSAEVVETYMGRDGGATERLWDDPATAPGDDKVRLKRVTVRGTNAGAEVQISDPLQIEVDYWNMSDDPSFRPYVNLHLFNAEGICLLVTWDAQIESWRRDPREPGLVTATCSIPGDFFAEGSVYVLVGISSLSPTTVHVREEDAVAFHVVDPGDGRGVRADYAPDWPGVVRPRFEWTVEQTHTMETEA